MKKEQIFERLKTAFPDADIEITDLTGGEDHWEVHIHSAQFSGLSRIEQHQMVMKPLDPELKSGELHALALKTKAKLVNLT